LKRHPEALERQSPSSLSQEDAEKPIFRSPLLGDESGEIDPFELSDRIHRFHDGISRDLYVLYGRLTPVYSVARAVALKVLQEAEVPAEILAALERPLQGYVAENVEHEEESGD
jgi:hypothetical protein